MSPGGVPDTVRTAIERLVLVIAIWWHSFFRDGRDSDGATQMAFLN